jgi:hypothetical protein
MAWLKYQVARITKAQIPFLSFGYITSDFARPRRWKVNSKPQHGLRDGFDPSEATLVSPYTQRPQTVSYALCDSPVGLLASVLDAIHARSTTLQSSKPQSPFLSPAELSEQTGQRSGKQSNEVELQMQEIPRSEMPLSPRHSETNQRDYAWTPTEILSWTMMQWLPGPEAGLRWLKQAILDCTPDHDSFWRYSPVPLGISHFRSRSDAVGEDAPLMWASSYSRLEWVKRHRRSARWPAWEAPDLLVLDLRECFGDMAERGLVRLRRDDGD